MMIRSIIPADQEQMLLLEEELHDNEGKERRATLEEALGSKKAISLLAEQAGDAVAYLLATEDQPLKGAIRENNLTTVDEITFYTKAGGGCGACKVKLEDILNEELAERERAQKNAPLTTVQKIKKIEEAIETVINPMLKMDGGSCKLVDIEGNIVKISFKGACSSCMASKNTLKVFVEPKIKELVDKDLEVVGV